MSEVATDFWERCLDALRVARRALSTSPDLSAASAYYSAFYAVSAHFALGGHTFRKHTALEAAVHRDLVKGKGWPSHLGSAYSRLNELRHVGHYGGSKHVTPAEAEHAIDMAEEIVRAVADAHPQDFALAEHES
ncbi:MAG: HEPN domain-containing protein [Planctomycetota bacterium]|nr:HEPN domain-containing protein [Planctomycetota bacterium]